MKTDTRLYSHEELVAEGGGEIFVKNVNVCSLGVGVSCRSHCQLHWWPSSRDDHLVLDPPRLQQLFFRLKIFLLLSRQGHHFVNYLWVRVCAQLWACHNHCCTGANLTALSLICLYDGQIRAPRASCRKTSGAAKNCCTLAWQVLLRRQSWLEMCQRLVFVL